eukprot:1654162-Amphidinium_carterae.1
MFLFCTILVVSSEIRIARLFVNSQSRHEDIASVPMPRPSGLPSFANFWCRENPRRPEIPNFELELEDSAKELLEGGAMESVQVECCSVLLGPIHLKCQRKFCSMLEKNVHETHVLMKTC